jgi:hypothetical protein
LRGLWPLPTIASCISPVSRGITWPQVFLRDAERAVVGDLQQKAVAARFGGAQQQVRVDFGQEPLRTLPLCSDVRVERRAARRRPILAGAHRLKRGLDVVDGGSPVKAKPTVAEAKAGEGMVGAAISILDAKDRLVF